MELEEEHSQSLRDIVSILPGKVYISITKQPNALPLVWEDPELDASMFHGVVAFAWFPPFPAALDTSFRALRPYSYAVPLGVRANEAMPLGIIIGLSESRELYDRLFTALIDMGVTEDEIGEKSFLSDQHPALVAVCSGRRHFLCLRHILDSFGPDSFLGRIAHRLAFSSTEDGLFSEMEASGYDILELAERGALDRDGLARLERLFGLGLSTEKSWRIGSAGAPRRSGPAHILELELAAIMQKVSTGPSMKQPVAFR